MRFNHLIRTLLAVCVSLAAACAAAQEFPNRPVTLIVPYPAGGGTDTMGRALARALSVRWDKPVVVENAVGADGLIGTQKVLAAKADGYTILMQVNQMLLWKSTMPHLKTDVMGDLTLVSMIARSPQAFAVSTKLPINDMKEFVAWCEKRPCQVGSATRLAELIGKQVIEAARLKDAVAVNYKGTAPMITDLIGGHITMGLPAVSASLQHVRAGSLRILAVGSSERFGPMKDVPTLIEQGFPVTGEAWYGVMVSKQTPAPILAEIVKGLQGVARDPEILKAIDTAGAEPVFSAPDAFAEHVERETRELDALIARFPLAK